MILDLNSRFVGLHAQLEGQRALLVAANKNQLDVVDRIKKLFEH